MNLLPPQIFLWRNARTEGPLETLEVAEWLRVGAIAEDVPFVFDPQDRWRPLAEIRGDLLGLLGQDIAAPVSTVHAPSPRVVGEIPPVLFWGRVLIGAGIFGFLFFGLVFDTGISTEIGRVNNLGRMNSQTGGLIVSAALFLGGIILLATRPRGSKR